MPVNIDKKKVVPQLMPLSMYVSDTIEVVDYYKYLSLTLTDTLDYRFTSSMVAKAASHALGLLIARFKAHGSLPYMRYLVTYTIHVCIP